MTKPTITDEDRAAAAEALQKSDVPWMGDHHYDEICLIFADHRQAAFNAGLERAAVIAEQYDDKRSLMTGVGIAVAAIRAEKEKPQ